MEATSPSVPLPSTHRIHLLEVGPTTQQLVSIIIFITIFIWTTPLWQTLVLTLQVPITNPYLGIKYLVKGQSSLQQILTYTYHHHLWWYQMVFPAPEPPTFHHRQELPNLGEGEDLAGRKRSHFIRVHIPVVVRHTRKVVTSKLTYELTRVRNLTNVTGKDVDGSLPGPMNWPVISGNILATDHSNVAFVRGHFHDLIISLSIWRDMLKSFKTKWVSWRIPVLKSMLFSVHFEWQYSASCWSKTHLWLFYFDFYLLNYHTTQVCHKHSET